MSALVAWHFHETHMGTHSNSWIQRECTLVAIASSLCCYITKLLRSFGHGCLQHPHVGVCVFSKSVLTWRLPLAICFSHVSCSECMCLQDTTIAENPSIFKHSKVISRHMCSCRCLFAPSAAANTSFMTRNPFFVWHWHSLVICLTFLDSPLGVYRALWIQDPTTGWRSSGNGVGSRDYKKQTGARNLSNRYRNRQNLNEFPSSSIDSKARVNYRCVLCDFQVEWDARSGGLDVISPKCFFLLSWTAVIGISCSLSSGYCPRIMWMIHSSW